MIDIGSYHNFDVYLLNEILLRHYKNKNYTNSKISFAWDNEKFLTLNFREAIKNAIGDAKTLVIIGYTFPFFNRNIDRMLFDFMPNLEKIYIQDPNANQIIQNLEPIYSRNHPFLSKLKNNIIPKTNTDQFYLPPEL
ncbi:MAG: hypothetical protein IKY54_01100 [Muribaculaceae bacterium]|nr:hypothetical protein [Muribaculaceae bacterium]